MDDDVRALLARNMKRYRRSLHLSQMALAARVGCSATMIGNIEIKKRFPSSATMGRIAVALRVAPHELLLDDVPVRARFDTLRELALNLELAIEDAIAESRLDGDDTSSQGGARATSLRTASLRPERRLDRRRVGRPARGPSRRAARVPHPRFHGKPLHP